MNFRNNREQHHDLHGFADSRLALVRRSMIARRTQARLREKRRRNRTVALSPEDDRRSSFISTFLDTKQLQDQSCQVPSQHSTLSNKTNVSLLAPCPELILISLQVKPQPIYISPQPKFHPTISSFKDKSKKWTRYWSKFIFEEF